MRYLRNIILPLAILMTGTAPAFGGEPADSLAAVPWNSKADYWKSAATVTPISLTEAEKSPVYDLRNKLTGLVPGLIVQESCGDIMPSSNMGSPGIDANTISLAGHGFGGLVLIVDDVLTPFNQYQFDINQVESLTYLSGATAKNLYGPRAGYGAILLTTRKGDWNKPLTINADVRAGMDFVDRMPEWVNSYEYAALNNIARGNDGYTQLYSNAALRGFAEGDMFSRKYPAVDYKSLMMRNYKETQNFGVDISGGSSILKYNASVNGYRSGDIYNAGPISDYNKLSMSTSITAKVGKWITGSVSFNGLTGFRRDNNGSLYGYRSIPGNAFPVAIGISTNDSDLEGISAGNTIYAVSRAFTTNPYAQLVDGGFATTRYRSGMFNAAIDLDMGWLLKGLKSRTFLDFDNEYYQKVGKTNDYIAYYWSQENDIAEISSHTGTKQASKSSKGTFTYNNLSFYERLSHEWKNGSHELKSGLVFFLSNGSNSSNNFYERQAYVVGNANYSYAGKYFAEITAEYAGSSRFADGNRFEFFPAAAFGWLVSEEPWMKDVRWVDKLKVSLDAGSIADADIYGSKYLYRASYISDSGNPFGPATAYQWFGSDKRTSQTTTIERLANHSLKWPRVLQADLKVDAKLLGCLDLMADAYVINRPGIISETSSEYPAMAGLTDIAIYDNYNAFLMYGLDMGAQYSRSFGDLHLSAGVNLLTYKVIYSKVVNDFYIYDWQRVTGTRYGNYRGFHCLGKFTSDAEIASSPLYDPDTRVGDLKYEDLNGDGKIDSNDTKVVGNTLPLLRCGINLNLEWKGWSLFLVGSGSFLTDIALTNGYFWNGWGDGNYSAFVRDNLGEAYPRLGYDKPINNFVASDFWLRDGSYFKIQTLEIAYSFVPKRLKAVKGVKLSLRGANLLTLTGVEYVEPENMNAGLSTYPLFRTFAAGAKFNF